MAALEQAMNAVLRKQIKHTSIPKRLTKVIREMWLLQFRFERRVGKRPLRIICHPRFRAGYDLLLLRSEAGDADKELAKWWTIFQFADDNTQQSMLAKLLKTRK